jgi:hypothetical protein
LGSSAAGEQELKKFYVFIKNNAVIRIDAKVSNALHILVPYFILIEKYYRCGVTTSQVAVSWLTPKMSSAVSQIKRMQISETDCLLFGFRHLLRLGR